MLKRRYISSCLTYFITRTRSRYQGRTASKIDIPKITAYLDFLLNLISKMGPFAQGASQPYPVYNPSIPSVPDQTPPFIDIEILNGKSHSYPFHDDLAFAGTPAPSLVSA